MKLHLVLACAASLSPTARADVLQLRGSDTLSGVIADAIDAAGLKDRLRYAGGGSGLGEKALVEKQQGFAPMSRAFKPDMLAAAHAAGFEPIGHVIGLDGIGIFVNAGNGTPTVTIDTLRKIFACDVTTWDKVPGSGRTGAIKVYRRDDNSGTTDTFKTLVGLDKFGACAQVVADTADIAAATAGEADAVGYAGLSAERPGNKPLPVAKTAMTQAIAPSVANIRNHTYPLTRSLYIYEASGGFEPAPAEREFLDHALDRSFLDPLLAKHEFFTLD